MPEVEEFMAWFVKEQVEEEYTMRSLLKIFRSSGDPQAFDSKVREDFLWQIKTQR